MSLYEYHSMIKINTFEFCWIINAEFYQELPENCWQLYFLNRSYRQEPTMFFIPLNTQFIDLKTPQSLWFDNPVNLMHRLQFYSQCYVPMMPLIWLAGLYFISPCSVSWGYWDCTCFHTNTLRAQSTKIRCYHNSTGQCLIKKDTHSCVIMFVINTRLKQYIKTISIYEKNNCGRIIECSHPPPKMATAETRLQVRPHLTMLCSTANNI